MHFQAMYMAESDIARPKWLKLYVYNTQQIKNYCTQDKQYYEFLFYQGRGLSGCCRVREATLSQHSAPRSDITKRRDSTTELIYQHYYVKSSFTKEKLEFILYGSKLLK